MKSILLSLLLLISTTASAMITVGRGNTPVVDSNWPAGALDVANLKSRVGWWEGPPFGGGQTQFLYRSDTHAFQQALDLFAKVRAPGLDLFIHEGPHDNTFLRDDADPKSNTRVDWTFTVWNPRSFHHLYNNPTSTFSSDNPGGNFRGTLEAPRVDVYVASAKGDGIDFTQIKVPANVTVTDERATAHGYAPQDKSILRGDVYDILASKPIAGAMVVVAQHKGGQAGYEPVVSGHADADGHFELRKIPAGSYRVAVFANGYVPRILGYAQFGSNTLKQYTTHLAAPVKVTGTALDHDGKPLPGVAIRAASILAIDGRGYVPADAPQAITDAAGAFELHGLPEGHLQIRAHLKSYFLLDPLKLHAAPGQNVALTLTTTGTVKGRVLKLDGKPAADAHIHLTPPGNPIGKYGGSTAVNPDGTFQFDSVPPGEYTLSTRPSLPGIAKDPHAKTIKVQPGTTTHIEITKE